jgi:hypothetical protein
MADCCTQTPLDHLGFNMRAAACRNLRGTNSTAASLASWMDSYFCTLHKPDYVTTPDGKEIGCGHTRRNIALIIWGVFLFLLVLVCYARWSASLLSCFAPVYSSGWWKGTRKWLLPQLKPLAVLLDLGSDVWVLVQVSVAIPYCCFFINIPMPAAAVGCGCLEQFPTLLPASFTWLLPAWNMMPGMIQTPYHWALPHQVCSQ